MAILTPYIAKWRHRVIEPYVRGNVLDVGCGNALILEQHAPEIRQYCGIERNAGTVSRLRNKYPEATFLQHDLDSDVLDVDMKFDCVLMIALIEHLFNHKFVMEGIAAALVPGGKVVITTPTPFGNDVVLRLGAVFGLFAKSAVDDHIVIYNRHRFKILANAIGLKVNRYEYFQLFCNQLVVLEKPS